MRQSAEDLEARINLAAESAGLAFWSIYPEKSTAWMSEKGRALYGFDLTQPLTRDETWNAGEPGTMWVFRKGRLAATLGS